ncbi:MAG: TetR/AcrR family transcriptional regulator [Sporolactobacillus sp.]
MADKTIRVPQQKRSIEKKKKILDAAVVVFDKKGYLEATTADIAAEANISVGTVYAYFRDKKDILLTNMADFSVSLLQDIEYELSELPVDADFFTTAKRIIEITIAAHQTRWSGRHHTDILSLRYIDPDIAAYFIGVQKKIGQMIRAALSQRGWTLRHPHEQIYLMFQIIDDLSETLTFRRRDDLDRTVLIDEAAAVIVAMIVSQSKHGATSD